MSEKLINAIAEMREEEALGIVKEMVEKGTESVDILNVVRKAMDIVGKRYEQGTYYLPELILAGEILNQITEIVKSGVSGSQKPGSLGKVLIGTVKGDIHDIGKDIVSFMLDANGFEVLDLGVDVPVQKFIDAIKDFQPAVVGLSGFLTLAFDSMKATISEISNAGLRDKVKIMIGGGQMDDLVKEYTGADAFGKDAMAAVTLAKNWIGG